MIPDTDFSIRTFIGGYDKNFTYLITCRKTNTQILIDAAIDIKHILPFINNEKAYLLITHTHNDHIAYINQYFNFLSDLTIIGHPKSNFNKKQKIKYIDINDNQWFKIGELNFKSIHTPGHYYDSICYQINPVLFTGDTLFVGRTGRVISSKSNINHLYNSIYKKILTLDNEIRIYPGHHYGDKVTVKICENIKLSPLLQAKNLDEFIFLMEQFEKSRTSN